MKDLMYIGTAFSAFSATILLSFIGNAFPSLYAGVHVVFSVGVFLLLVLGLVLFLVVAIKRQSYLRQSDMWLAAIPAIVGIALLFLAYGVGAWVALGAA